MPIVPRTKRAENLGDLFVGMLSKIINFEGVGWWTLRYGEVGDLEYLDVFFNGVCGWSEKE